MNIQLFKSNTKVLTETKLPNEIILKIYEYIENRKHQNDLKILLPLIRFKGKLKKFKRCTLCLNCNKIKTYNIYCSTCDDDAWNDIG